MRVLVCGGRDYVDAKAAFLALNILHAKRCVTALIHGGARGADSLGAAWATNNGIRTEKFAADWAAHGKGAGHIRNQRMLVEGEPELVVAFPGGRGTADMVRRAKAAGVPVWHPYND